MWVTFLLFIWICGYKCLSLSYTPLYHPSLCTPPPVTPLIYPPVPVPYRGYDAIREIFLGIF